MPKIDVTSPEYFDSLLRGDGLNFDSRKANTNLRREVLIHEGERYRQSAQGPVTDLRRTETAALQEARDTSEAYNQVSVGLGAENSQNRQAAVDRARNRMVRAEEVARAWTKATEKVSGMRAQSWDEVKGNSEAAVSYVEANLAQRAYNNDYPGPARQASIAQHAQHSNENFSGRSPESSQRLKQQPGSEHAQGRGRR
ncbi:hypothetical protein [Streptomyces mirabilis]